MNEITIDFSLCQTPEALHTELKNKLNLPAFYGKNVDALWDLLTGFCKMPMHICLKECTKGATDVMHEMSLIKETLFDFQKEYPENKITVL